GKRKTNLRLRPPLPTLLLLVLPPPPMSYKRIMLKLSGEVFSAHDEFGIHMPTLQGIAGQIVEIASFAQVVVVLGGGNICPFRDTQESGIERTVSDAMGMLA